MFDKKTWEKPMQTLWTALLLSIFSVSAHAMHSGQEEGSASESTPVAASASSSAQAGASAGAEGEQGVD